MKPKTPRQVDFDKMAWLLEMFKTECKTPDKLFHVTRVVIDPSQEQPEGHERDWNEFRPDVEFFGSASYDRGLTGFQHHSYHGSRRRLLEYTGWAARALMQMPGVFCPMSDSDRNAVLDRDAWTWGLYRVALRIAEDLPIDLQGNGDYSRTRPQNYPWLRLAAANVSSPGDREQQNLLAWQSQAGVEAGFAPKYVYASLALDVFACSAVALGYFLSNAEELFFRSKGYSLSPRYYAEPTASSQARASDIRSFIQVDRDKCIVMVDGNPHPVSPNHYSGPRKLDHRLSYSGGPGKG